MSGTSEPGERLRLGRDALTIRVSGEVSGGSLVALDVEIPAGGGPPALHRHPSEELYRVESGELALYLQEAGGELRRVLARPGDVVHIPGGLAHTVRNESGAEALAYVVFVPGTEMEGFARAAAALPAGEAPDPSAVMALAGRHGIEITGAVVA